MEKRIESLDYLRGLMAFAIMLIHYRTWIIMDNSTAPAPIFGSIIIYGVSIFFILSGITMYLAYKNSFNLSYQFVCSFAIKRIFRIFPLLWLLTTLRPFFYGNIFTLKQYLLTYTGLFAFADVTKGVARLSWSIGVELVFYTLFPLFLYLIAKPNKSFYYFLWIFSFCIFYYFAFYHLDSTKTIVTQGPVYVNPLNHIFLFMTGITIGHYKNTLEKVPSWLMNTVLIAIILIVALFPIGRDLITIMTGLNRMLLSLLSIIICIGFLANSFHLPKILRTCLLFLGEKSYGIYLLHPLAFDIFFKLSKHYPINKVTFYLASVILSLILSKFVFDYIENPMIQVGKKASSKFFAINGAK